MTIAPVSTPRGVDTDWLDVDQYTTARVRPGLRDANDELLVLQREVRRVARHALRAPLAYEAQVADSLSDTIRVRQHLDEASGATTLLETVESLLDDLRSIDETWLVGLRPLWWVEEMVAFRETVPWINEMLDELREPTTAGLAVGNRNRDRTAGRLRDADRGLRSGPRWQASPRT